MSAISIGAVINATQDAVSAANAQSSNPSAINLVVLNSSLLAFGGTIGSFLPGQLGPIIGVIGQAGSGVGLGINIGTLFDDSKSSSEKAVAGLGVLSSIAGFVGSNPLMPPHVRLVALLAQSVFGGAAVAISTDPGLFNDLMSGLFDGLSLLGNNISSLLDVNYLLDPTTNTRFTRARIPEPPRVDPLVLDLDGDGIETVGIQPGAAVLFDHDADGLKTGSGWVKADDGILVLDLDGNGRIETGRELFGDQTLVQSGANAGQRAANGLAALAQYDTHTDARIDSADAIYSQLQVWQDLNQDGISQSSELHSLAELGIASINLSGTPSNTALQDANTGMASGNTLQASASFTRVDGSTGVSGCVARRRGRSKVKMDMSPRRMMIVCYRKKAYGGTRMGEGLLT